MLLSGNLQLEPGNYAVIFTSERELDQVDYDQMDTATMEAVQQIDGFLGYESVRNGKQNIFISYWRDVEAVNVWRENALHRQAKSRSAQWYDAYRVTICPIESTRFFRKA